MCLCATPFSTTSRFDVDWKRRRSIFETIAKKFNIKGYDDWYNVKISELKVRGHASGLLKAYNGSLAKALRALYPEHNWQEWRFRKVPQHFWDNKQNILRYMKWVSDEIGVVSMRDWYSLSNKQFIHLGGSRLLMKYGGLIPLLSHLFPHCSNASQFYPLQKMRSSHMKNSLPLAGKAQRHLWNIVQRLFPMDSVLLNFIHPQMAYPESFIKMEFDLFIPSLSLVFEYQGEQHFYWNLRSGKPQSQQSRDNIKRKISGQHGLTIVEIPFWWRGDIASLCEYIERLRPDLLHKFLYPLGLTSEKIPFEISATRTSYRKSRKEKYLSLTKFPIILGGNKSVKINIAENWNVNACDLMMTLDLPCC